LEGLKHGNDVLSEIHKETSVEAVEKLMDDTADAIAYQNVRIRKKKCHLIFCSKIKFIDRKLMKC
jgi:hypothetical protein